MQQWLQDCENVCLRQMQWYGGYADVKATSENTNVPQ